MQGAKHKDLWQKDRFNEASSANLMHEGEGALFIWSCKTQIINLKLHKGDPINQKTNNRYFTEASSASLTHDGEGDAFRFKL
jgi:hypothetical protein